MASARFASLVDEFQAAVLAAAWEGAVVLVGTPRLARALRERWRTEQLAAGRPAWERAPIFSLAAWTHHLWSQSWPDKGPAPPFLVWRRLSELAADDPPPGENRPGVDLAEALDVTYKVLADHVPTPFRDDPASPGVEWRRRMFDRLDQVLDRDGFFHPAQMSVLVAQGIRDKIIPLPRRILQAGFDFPSAAERALFAAVEARAELIPLDLPTASADQARAVALADREQEEWWVVGETVQAAARTPLDRIGLVVPDITDYGPGLDRALNQALGENRPEDGFWYNSVRRPSLLERPLVKAALAPLRAAARPVDRLDLLDLIGAPFFSALAAAGPEVFQADRSWRERPVFGTMRDFLSDPAVAEGLRLGPDGRRLDEVLAPLLAAGSRPIAVWTTDLGRVLEELGFEPGPGDEDQADRLDFDRVLSDLARDLGPLRTDGAEFRSWIEAALGRTPARNRGTERAGVQVLLPEEARGLCFNRLFILGMDARAWPRPVRSLPLLTPGERARVLGGTVESEYRFSARAFGVLCASAAEVVLTRPRHEGDEPRPASIFWPGGEEEAEISPWRRPDPAWLRARWYGDAWQGMAEPRPEFSDAPAPGLVPRTISVSRLETALTCPAMFLAQVILGLTPLEEPEPGVTPQERGRVLHKVLQVFTGRLRAENIDLDSPDAERLLVQCVDQVLGRRINVPVWRVERARWLDEPGLLRPWLELERARFQQGWRIIAEEIDFSDLVVAEVDLSLKGRIDRIDVHDEEGLICWDYKSGEVPSGPEVFDRLVQPQLLAYMEALHQGVCHLPEQGQQCVTSGRVRAGYLQLKSAAKVRSHLEDKEPEAWDEARARWLDRLREIFEPLHQGRFPAEPHPAALKPNTHEPCSRCPYGLLCHRLAGEEES
jgi:ATP-dependent helicase/nuclease subunit B